MTSIHHRMMEMINESVLSSFLDKVKIRKRGRRKLVVSVPEEIMREIARRDGVSVDIEIRRISCSVKKTLSISYRINTKYGTLGGNFYIPGYQYLPDAINEVINKVNEEPISSILKILEDGEKHGFDVIDLTTLRKRVGTGEVTILISPFYLHSTRRLPITIEFG